MKKKFSILAKMSAGADGLSLRSNVSVVLIVSTSIAHIYGQMTIITISLYYFRIGFIHTLSLGINTSKILTKSLWHSLSHFKISSLGDLTFKIDIFKNQNKYFLVTVRSIIFYKLVVSLVIFK